MQRNVIKDRKNITIDKDTVICNERHDSTTHVCMEMSSVDSWKDGNGVQSSVLKWSFWNPLHSLNAANWNEK